MSPASYYLTEVLETVPVTRKVSAAMKREIGAFFVSWGRVENELDVAFHVLFRIDPTLASCVTSNLATRAKIDSVSSATDMLEEVLGVKRAAAIQAALSRVQELNDRARNTIAHGAHHPWEDEKTGKQFNAVLRFAARKQLRATAYPGNASYWARMSRGADAAALALRRHIKASHEKLKRVSEDEIWEMTGFRSATAQPILFRRRKAPRNS